MLPNFDVSTNIIQLRKHKNCFKLFACWLSQQIIHFSLKINLILSFNQLRTMENQQQISLATNTVAPISNRYQLLQSKIAYESKIKNICIVAIIIIIVSNYFQVRSMKQNYVNLEDLIKEIAKNVRENRQNIISQTNYRIGNISETNSSFDKRLTQNSQILQETKKSLTAEVKKIATKMSKFQQTLNSVRKAVNQQKKVPISQTSSKEISLEVSEIAKKQINQVKEQFHQNKQKWLKSMLNHPTFAENQKARLAFQTSLANIVLFHQNALSQSQNNVIQESIRQRLQKDYKLKDFQKELPFCIVVPTYNNAKNFRYQYNLQSILNLNYKNYKVVIIDDASTDGTYELITDFISTRNLDIDIRLHSNQVKMTAVPNINKAIREYCDEGDIAVLVDGDDQLLIRDSLRVFNSIYQSQKVDVVYSNHLKLYWHQNDVFLGWSQPYAAEEIKDNAYRDVPQKISHLRSFKASLFLQIKEEDLKDQSGSWFQSTYDEVICLPILEMSCGRIAYLDEYFYLYNFGIGTNDIMVDKQKQKQIADLVKHKKKKYSCLKIDQ